MNLRLLAETRDYLLADGIASSSNAVVGIGIPMILAGRALERLVPLLEGHSTDAARIQALAHEAITHLDTVAARLQRQPYAAAYRALLTLGYGQARRA